MLLSCEWIAASPQAQLPSFTNPHPVGQCLSTAPPSGRSSMVRQAWAKQWSGLDQDCQIRVPVCTVKCYKRLFVKAVKKSKTAS